MTPRSRWAVVAAAVALAVVANLVVYLVGRLAGGRFTFSQSGAEMHVDAATVAGFSAVPLLVGLTVVALLGRRLPVLHRVALVVAPSLAVVTVGVLTLPADFDAVSTATLALCHLTLVPISVVALLALRRSAATATGHVRAGSAA